MLFFVISALLSLQVEALPNVFQYEIAKAQSFVHTFEMPRKENYPSEGQRKLGPAKWEDCSSTAPLVNIKSLSITPDPLHFPGPLDVATEFTIKENLLAPLKVDLLIKKKILGTYIEIPCIDNFGSCKYDDICQVLSQVGDQCPDPLKKIGIKCSCPFGKGTYNLPKTEFDLTADVIPSGEYEIQANVTMQGAEVVCLKLFLIVE
ncbi:ganglioside GM2 activator-like [Mercenaria mercenaria]|uniref:ganglioside GM2 activator-like n=1 Tax=Mercenaria mercenaria TaxID=6596 RepID=UPI00234ED013|nr:ganglioside GM2 activator-like [Mercenaria mercenaria]